MTHDAFYVPLCVFSLYPNSNCNSNPETNPTQPYFLTLTTPAFRPQSEKQLQTAVDECIKMSIIGDCSEGPHGPIGDWDVSAVTDMGRMFYRASAFNQDVSKWDVSAVTNMNNMFSDASAFNQDVSKWDVSRVFGMRAMFMDASAFNQDVSKWDVSKVTGMRAMFMDASAFNQDLSKWDVSKVTDMGYMFARASVFDQDLSKWDVSKVTEMMSMFRDASAFNRKLCGDTWVQSKADKSEMFTGSPGSISSTVCKTAKHGHGGDYGKG